MEKFSLVSDGWVIGRRFATHAGLNEARDKVAAVITENNIDANYYVSAHPFDHLLIIVGPGDLSQGCEERLNASLDGIGQEVPVVGDMLMQLVTQSGRQRFFRPVNCEIEYRKE